MKLLFGKIKNLLVSVDTHSQEEQLTLLETNYKLTPFNIVAWEVTAITSDGERVKVDVHEVEHVEFTEFVEV
jgi:2-oxo-4-hydroxy-4-carboxy--5-ureidoimidazoline (OHCU) decarboxylase